MKEYKGILFGWFETGCEGTRPAIQEHIGKDGMWSYTGLHEIDPGDHLTILKDDKEIFSGVIESINSCDAEGVTLVDEVDFVAKWERYPQNPKLGQLHINNYWVHYLPTNVDLQLWWDVFFASSGEYHGILRTENDDR
jgi:hypothetical protein